MGSEIRSATRAATAAAAKAAERAGIITPEFRDKLVNGPEISDSELKAVQTKVMQLHGAEAGAIDAHLRHAESRGWATPEQRAESRKEIHLDLKDEDRASKNLGLGKALLTAVTAQRAQEQSLSGKLEHWMGALSQ